jgi:hypothetical protein
MLGEDRHQLVRRMDGALGLVLGRPHHHGDPTNSLDQVLARRDVGRVCSLQLTRQLERAAREVDVTDLHAECLATAQAGEGAQGRATYAVNSGRDLGRLGGSAA